MKALIQLENGYAKWRSLPSPIWEGSVSRETEVSPGRFLTGLYYGSRTGRAVIRSYSIWDRGDGQCYGEEFREVSLAEFLAAAKRVGARLPAALDRAE